MNYKKECDPIEHAINLCTLREMEELIPMDYYERNRLRDWVYRGNAPEKNPWHYVDKDGYPMNFLEAYRYHNGYKLIYKYITIEE